MSRSQRFLIEFLVWHVFAFFVIGVVLIGLTWALKLDDLSTPIGFGFIMGWIGSVGCIAHIGNMRRSVRWGVSLALVLLGCFAFHPKPLIITAMVVTLFLVALLTGIRRLWCRCELKIPTDPSPAFIPIRTQFTIRQLLILTTMIGCLLGIGRLVWPWIPSFQLVEVYDLVYLSITFLPCACFGWLAVWASGIANEQYDEPRFRIALALLVASTLAQSWLLSAREAVGHFCYWYFPLNLTCFLYLYFCFRFLWSVEFRLISNRPAPTNATSTPPTQPPTFPP